MQWIGFLHIWFAAIRNKGTVSHEWEYHWLIDGYSRVCCELQSKTLQKLQAATDFLYVWVVWCLMFKFWSNWIPSYLYEFVSDRVLWWCTTSSVLFFCVLWRPEQHAFCFTISWFSSNQVATGAKSSVRLDLIKFAQSLYKL